VTISTHDLVREWNAIAGEGGHRLPLLAYGTLRVGEGNYSWAKEAVLDEIPNVQAVGSLYHVRPYMRAYPVAKFDRPGVIIGDLLIMHADHPVTDSVIRMEEGAGYELRKIMVQMPDGSEREAFGFHYLYEPDGPRIVSGNWLEDHHI